MEEYPMRREGTPASGLKRTPASLSSGAARSSSSSIAECCSSRIHSAPAAPRRASGTGEARGAGAAPRTHPARAGRGRRASAAPRRGPLSPGGGAGSHPSPARSTSRGFGARSRLREGARPSEHHRVKGGESIRCREALRYTCRDARCSGETRGAGGTAAAELRQDAEWERSGVPGKRLRRAITERLG